LEDQLPFIIKLQNNSARRTHFIHLKEFQLKENSGENRELNKPEKSLKMLSQFRQEREASISNFMETCKMRSLFSQKIYHSNQERRQLQNSLAKQRKLA